MSLVAGHGPLSKDPAGWFSSPLPADLVFVEPHPRRVQAFLDGRMVIDTEHALMVHRRDHALSYVFLAEEVGGLPSEPEPHAPGYLHVPWDAVDTWLEEGRELVHYPPNPYHRVDCRPTPCAAGDGRGHHPGGHRRHGDPFRNGAGTPSLRCAFGGAPRSAAAIEHQHLLQLQGLRHVLVGHRRRRGGSGYGVELRGSAAGMPSRQGVPELRRHVRRRLRRPTRSVKRATSHSGHLAPYGFVTVGYGCVRFPWSATLLVVCQREGKSCGALHRQCA